MFPKFVKYMFDQKFMIFATPMSIYSNQVAPVGRFQPVEVEELGMLKNVLAKQQGNLLCKQDPTSVQADTVGFS